jgi:hypothetical protein
MRNEDYDRELLVTVTVICAALAAVVSVFETTSPSRARADAPGQARAEQLAPVRVVGTPFVLNTNPRER